MTTVEAVRGITGGVDTHCQRALGTPHWWPREFPADVHDSSRCAHGLEGLDSGSSVKSNAAMPDRVRMRFST
jgi:hypothetical protein